MKRDGRKQSLRPPRTRLLKGPHPASVFYMASLENIRDYLRLDDRLSTSGMPQAAQFADIGRAGFEVVINLALPTSDDALPNEGELVTRAGMTYVHIPVNFEKPA